MSASTPSTILLRVNDVERRIYEKIADVALTPGECLANAVGGEVGPVGTAGANSLIMVCIETPYLDPGVTSTKAIDTDYAVGDLARYIIPQRGDIVYAWLAAGANVSEGAALEFDNAGAFQALTTGAVKAYAAEDVDNSAGGSRVRIRVTIA